MRQSSLSFLRRLVPIKISASAQFIRQAAALDPLLAALVNRFTTAVTAQYRPARIQVFTFGNS